MGGKPFTPQLWGQCQVAPSPDKDVDFACTTASFTLPPEPLGLLRRLSELPSPDSESGWMKFLFVGSQLCRWASFGRRLATSPLPLASSCCSILLMDEPRFSYRGLSPHQSTPMLGVHNADADNRRYGWRLRSGI